MNATSYTPTSITVCFEFPEGSALNGLLTSFNIILVGFPFVTDSLSVQIPITSTDYPLTGSMCGRVKDLQEYNNYTIIIVLVNSVGPGPDSTLIGARTLETGNFKVFPIEK